MLDIKIKDEGIKIIVCIIVLFITFSIFIIFLNTCMLNKLNEKYITQNLMVISKIEEKNSDIVKDIIPIITGKEVVDIANAEKIMKGYSYDLSLEKRLNPLFGDQLKKYSNILVISTFIIIIITVFFVYKLIKPLYREIKYLTKKAEYIVDNKEIKFNMPFYSGSLDKFVIKFDLMEERVKHSIYLLKEEKINLKNIINDISHQLKTPLTALSMYNDILADHENMECNEINEFLLLNKEQLERMEWLVKTLLKYARLESNVIGYNKEVFSLNNTIEESINPLIIKVKEKSQSLTFNANKEIRYIHDRKWVGEAISNIIKNAIEHTEIGGEIQISLTETPISIIISIKDNGEGIEKSEIKKIFNRFYKGENSRNPTSIGIGLCLSRSIIRAHNGDITVESKVGVGSTFYVIFLKKV